MRERGQVFTLDMLFALVLVATIVSVSAQAFEFASRQAEDYSTRYSLERVANDAADVLVKTSGWPSNWEENIGNLEAIGLTEKNEGEPIQNTLSIRRLGWLRDLCRRDNWEAQRNENAVDAVKALFGGSENFEINIYDENGDNLWSIWPGWDVPGASSGSGNSLEVVVARRLIAKRRSGSIRAEVRGLQHLVAGPGGKDYFLDFWVYPGELDVFDWYIVLQPSEEANPTTKIWVNRSAGNHDYNFPPKANTVFVPRYHGVDDDDIDNALTDVENNGQPNNYLKVNVTGDPAQWVDVFIVILPRCSPFEFAVDAPDTIPAVLEVKLWR